MLVIASTKMGASTCCRCVFKHVEIVVFTYFLTALMPSCNALTTLSSTSLLKAK